MQRAGWNRECAEYPVAEQLLQLYLAHHIAQQQDVSPQMVARIQARLIGIIKEIIKETDEPRADKSHRERSRPRVRPRSSNVSN